MPRYETRSGQFGLVSGIHQPGSDMVLAVEPAGLFTPEARKGHLYIVAETDQDVARGRDACQLVMRTIRRLFYEDTSFSVTSALRKALLVANRTLYQHNFNVTPQKRAVVGVTCAVLKGNDLYIAQVKPAQAYLMAEGKLRALPSNTFWNPAQQPVAPLLKTNALGTSLTIEPDLYRATLRPGDALLLSSSNIAPLLNREEIMRLLRLLDPAEMAERLRELCKQHEITEAHGLALAAFAPLSPAAQSAPLSRVGISERVTLGMRLTVDWATRVTGEAALLVLGPIEQARRRRADTRRERKQGEQALLDRMPDQPLQSPNPPSGPRPLNLGETLDQRTDPGRPIPSAPVPDAARLPPSALLGEGSTTFTGSSERRIDLSDIPSMATFGRNARPASASEGPLGSRVRQPIDRMAGFIESLGRRRRMRQPPPNAMQARRQPGLSYRRQSPPFPWLWLLLLISLVAVLILYGNTLLRENAVREADNALVVAERAVAEVRDAPDEAIAQQKLDAAAEALAEVRASGLVTATLDNRRRFDELQREYERALAAIQKLTYFDDLKEVAKHPLPGGVFDSVVVPPPPNGITNTAAFAWIYLLDTNIGTLYRVPKNGGPVEAMLRPNDRFGDLDVGKIKAQTWRFDNIVAVSQNTEGGAYTFYFRNGETWSFSNLAGSEEWGRANQRFRAVNYEGNLYIWGAAQSNNVLRYRSGEYGNFPLPWIQNDGGKQINSIVDIAVDGKIYLLQPDGHVLVFATKDSGERAFEREIVPQGINPPLVSVTRFFVTGEPDNGAIYLADTNSERIIQIDKRTGALIQQVRVRSDSSLQFSPISLYVDESAGRPILYIVNSGQILRGLLPERPRPFRDPRAVTPPAGTPTAPAGVPTPTRAP